MKSKDRMINLVVLVIEYLMGLGYLPFFISTMKKSPFLFVLAIIPLVVWTWFLYRQTKKFLNREPF